MKRPGDSADLMEDLVVHSCLEDIRNDLLGRLFGGRGTASDHDAGNEILKDFSDALGGARREDLLAWVRELVPMMSKEQHRALLSLRKHLSGATATLPPEAPLLRDWFSALVGFALMRVDPRYRLMYYIDICHELLPDDLIKSVMKSVRVPLDEGSVGAAALRGALSLPDSVMDLRGVVASEDLAMGNISIMMIRIEDLDGECAAVIFCFFPLADVFAALGPLTLQSVVQSDTESTDPKIVQKLKALKCFASVCLSHQKAVLAEISACDADFVLKKTAWRLSPLQEAQDPTLDVLASAEIACNPTGGLIAVRKDRLAIRACLPRLESALDAEIAPPAQWFSDVLRAWCSESRDPRRGLPRIECLPDKLIAKELNAYPYPVPLGRRRSWADPPMMIVLHAKRNIQVDDIPEETVEEVLEFLDAFHAFTRTRKAAYEQGVRSDSSPAFRAAKVTVDACETLARFIARSLVDNRDVKRDTTVTARILVSALRHLGREHVPHASDVESNLRELIADLDLVPEDLLAVSVYYWAHHHLEPVWPPEGVSRELREFESPAQLRLLRRAAVKSFFGGEAVSIDAPPSLWSNASSSIDVRGTARPGGGGIHIALKLPDGQTQTMSFSNEPRYRMAGLALGQAPFQEWLQEYYGAQQADGGAAVLEDLKRCMKLEKAADSRRSVDLVKHSGDWPVEVYTLAGEMSHEGKKLADLLQAYEQHHQDRATAEWSHGLQLLFQHVSEPLLALDRFASAINNGDEHAEHRIRYILRSVTQWTEAISTMTPKGAISRRDHRNSWERPARVLESALSSALLTFGAGMTRFQAERWSLGHLDSPHDYIRSTISPPATPRDHERSARGTFAACKKALNGRLRVEPKSWVDVDVEVQGNPLLRCILMEIFRTVLEAASNTEGQDALLRIDVRPEGIDRKASRAERVPTRIVIVIRGNAKHEDAQRLCAGPPVPDPSTWGGMGVDLVDWAARRVGLEVSRELSSNSRNSWCWMTTRVRLPEDWVRAVGAHEAGAP